MDWAEIVIDTTTEGSDIIADMLYEAGVAGVAIEDPGEARLFIDKKGDWDYIEPNALKTEGNIVKVKGYMPMDGISGRGTLDTLKKKLAGIPRGYLNLGSLSLSIGSVSDESWIQSWKKHYKPFRVGKRIVIRPSSEEYEPEAGDIVVTMDPGMAFGSGTHESTALCIVLLERYVNEGDRVLDIGCGSGILSVVAAKLGAKAVEAYDSQPRAVDIAKENAAINGIKDRFIAATGDLLNEVEGRADVIVSNIVADTIIRMGPAAAEHLNPGAVFIASGIIKDRKRDVLKALLDNKMEIVEQLERKEWVALVARLKEQLS